MSGPLPRVQRRTLRRLALQRQGLLATAAFGRGRTATLRAVERLGYVQIDTISVVERAHHHVLRSRVPNFEPKQLRSLLAEGRVFEYWSHAAAYLPMRDFRFSLPRKKAFLRGERHWGRSRDLKLMSEILARVKTDGPLKSRDFEHRGGGGNDWWDWKPAKQALEQLFMQGELMISAREGFEKSYDLPERVLPSTVDTREPSIEEFAAHLVDSTLHAHGFASAPSLSYLRKGTELRHAIKRHLEQRIDDGQLFALQLDNGATYYGEPELLESAPARILRRVKILSPFDNSLIQRERGRQLFGFDYQIECYLPADRRRFGYFCLPLLYGDVFMGRMDCKAHRKTGQLEIKALYLENGFRADESCAASLAQSVAEYAHFNGCNCVIVRFCADRAFSDTLVRSLGDRIEVG
jgi:uncharacterized protein YcaQ